MFNGYFAIRLEFDQTKSKSDSIFFYVTVSVLTGVLFLMNLLEYYVIYKRNNAKVILKDVVKESRFFIFLRLVASIIHPNLLFFRERFIDEFTYNGGPDVIRFERNFNEYLYLF